MTTRRIKRPKTCKGKARYRDHPEAIKHMHWIQGNLLSDQVPVRAYHCPDCNGYHLTKKGQA